MENAALYGTNSDIMINLAQMANDYFGRVESAKLNFRQKVKNNLIMVFKLWYMRD